MRILPQNLMVSLLCRFRHARWWP